MVWYKYTSLYYSSIIFVCGISFGDKLRILEGVLEILLEIVSVHFRDKKTTFISIVSKHIVQHFTGKATNITTIILHWDNRTYDQRMETMYIKCSQTLIIICDVRWHVVVRGWHDNILNTLPSLPLALFSYPSTLYTLHTRCVASWGNPDGKEKLRGFPQSVYVCPVTCDKY